MVVVVVVVVLLLTMVVAVVVVVALFVSLTIANPTLLHFTANHTLQSAPSDESVNQLEQLAKTATCRLGTAANWEVSVFLKSYSLKVYL